MNPSLRPCPESPCKILSIGWTVYGVVCAWIIGATDDSLASALFWSTGSIVFGDSVLPALMRRAEQVNARYRWDFLSVVVGWGLVPGPLVGSLFGVLAPLIWELPITALQGGLIGFILGPLFTAVEGLILFTLVLAGYWAVTGELIPGTQLFPAKRTTWTEGYPRRSSTE